MKRSVDRFLTTHVGSLPRKAEWLDMLRRREKGEKLETATYTTQARAQVRDIVGKQRNAGIDIVGDGEQNKSSFIGYVNRRLGGWVADTVDKDPWEGSREIAAFPEFYKSSAPVAAPRLLCREPIRYTGHDELKLDIENLKAAIDGSGAADAFMPSISTTNLEVWLGNEYYKTQEEYLYGIADAMREEYKAIVDAGLILQIDDPRLATYYTLNKDASIEDCRKWANIRVEALNHALRGIPEDRVRMHTCYSIDIGPRVHEIELKHIVDIMLKIRVGAYSFEAANPRHEHEWEVWKDTKLPAGKILIPGVISHTTVVVEHPELVSQRLLRFASLVGRENIIAGVDCGFASFAGAYGVHPTVVWPKFESLVAGAKLASKRLWQ